MFIHHITSTNTSGLGNTKEYIVLHHTGTAQGSITGILRRFTSGTVSAHYVIDTDGTTYQCNTDDDILRHAGSSEWEGKTSLNDYSIGIEIVGPLPGFTDEQRISLRILVQSLVQKYRIPSKNIIRHKDIASGRKTDPDDSLWSAQYPTFVAFQQSFDAVQVVVGFYQEVFMKEFGDGVHQQEYVIQDIDTVIQRITRPDGRINISELVYFIAIGLERVHKQLKAES